MAKTQDANVADLSSQLSDMLNTSAKEARGDADVDATAPEAKAAGGKSVWKGTITLPNGQPNGVLAKFSAKSYTATDDDSFERHMYHSAECLNPVKYGAMTCSGCGVTLQKSQTVKGSETADGKIVLISDDELAMLVPQNEKVMKITEYVDDAEINPIYLESTEFVKYDGANKSEVETAKGTFAAVIASLQQTGKVAKGIRVKRGKEQYFILRPFGQHGMTLHVLRAAFEVRDANSLWEATVPNAQVVALLNQQTAMPELAKKFTPAKQDQYTANARKLVATKAAGGESKCPMPEPEQAGSTDDLLAQLQATLNQQSAKAGK